MTKDSSKKINILFVCSGNTCRSPMAAAIAQAYFGDDYVCASAGTRTIKRDVIEQKAKTAVNKLGFPEITQTDVTQVTQELIDQADIVFYLGDNILEDKESHYPSLTSLFSSSRHKFFKYAQNREKLPDPHDTEGLKPNEINALISKVNEGSDEINRIQTKNGLYRRQETYDFVAKLIRDDFTPHLQNARSPDDNTPLMMLIETGNIDVALKVLEIPDTDLTIKNKRGMTALDLAKEKKDEKLIKAISDKLKSSQGSSITKKPSIEDDQEKLGLKLFETTNVVNTTDNIDQRAPGTNPRTNLRDEDREAGNGSAKKPSRILRLIKMCLGRS